ncbi:MAG: DUF134 domain-containing protein [Firmicutes bacterium]|jgi:predicted DNA-binding protein (UPF0251 family)/predicted Fe-Mo cluster-binding NifX family protein|nr:DUF134 domain-containing protein [Bacillota bacterium]
MNTRKKRYCRRLEREKIYKPCGPNLNTGETVKIELDEFEAIRLCDYEGLSQIDASKEMNVSRATIQRLLLSGRKKLVSGLLNNNMIMVKNETSNITLKGENKMNTNLEGTLKIAFPTSNKNTVDEHFGHCEFFAIYDINSKKIVKEEFVEAPEHQPGLLPRFLGELNITTIITGGMGQRAIDLFKAQNIDVILGARGEIMANLNEYLGGDLESTGSACTHDHDH